VGLPSKKNSSPGWGGRKSPTEMSFAPSGALFICALIPTVSPWAIFGRRSATSNGFPGKSLTFPFDTSATRIHFCAMNFTESRWLPIGLLTCSNVFMTFVFLPKE
jgi:hypothetical protein